MERCKVAVACPAPGTALWNAAPGTDQRGTLRPTRVSRLTVTGVFRVRRGRETGLSSRRCAGLGLDSADPARGPRSPRQVAVMQVELTALQPQLIHTSEETARMMVKIEEETREADAKKVLVQADEKEANKAAAVAQGIKVRGAGGAGGAGPSPPAEGLALLRRCPPALRVRAGRPLLQSCQAAARSTRTLRGMLLSSS